MATLIQETISLKEWSCLYWAPFTCSCLLVKEGLFIPLKEYILLYCHSSRFLLCPHYQRLVSDEKSTNIKQKEPINHRRSIRFPGYYEFYFSKFMGKHLFKKWEDITWTFDVSEHGICFASEKLLTPDTAIHFLLEDDEVAATVEGVGKITWCAPIKKTSLFQVGVAVGWLCR